MLASLPVFDFSSLEYWQFDSYGYIELPVLYWLSSTTFVTIFLLTLPSTEKVRMKSELRAEVYKVYQSYLDAFNREDLDGINACIEFPLTHIGNGNITVLDKFPLSPTEMKKAKGWHRSDSVEIDIVAMTETKAHLLCRNVRRLREDGSLIEQASVFYAFKKTADGWKMFAISDVVNPAD